MIVVRLYIVISSQIFGEALAVLARDAIDDTTLASKACRQYYFYVLLDVLDLLLFADLEKEVRPIKRALKVNYLLCDSEASGNVILHFLGRCRSQTEKGHFFEALFEHLQVQVVLSEVLTPR